MLLQWKEGLVACQLSPLSACPSASGDPVAAGPRTTRVKGWQEHNKRGNVRTKIRSKRGKKTGYQRKVKKETRGQQWVRLGKRVMGEIMVGKKDCEKRGRENKYYNHLKHKWLLTQDLARPRELKLMMITCFKLDCFVWVICESVCVQPKQVQVKNVTNSCKNVNTEIQSTRSTSGFFQEQSYHHMLLLFLTYVAKGL